MKRPTEREYIPTRYTDNARVKTWIAEVKIDSFSTQQLIALLLSM